MACLLQRLAVRLTYLTALFTYQRTLERRNLPYTINTNRKVHFGKNRFAFFLSHHIGTAKCCLLSWLIKKFHFFPLSLHISPLKDDLLQKCFAFFPFTTYRDRKRRFASIFEKKFLFLLHIGTTTCDLMTKSRNFFIFLLPHHICPASSCLLSWKRKKSRFLLSIPYLSADRPNNDCLRKFLENIFQSKIPLFLRNSGISL